LRESPELKQNFQSLGRREVTVVLAISLLGFTKTAELGYHLLRD
jgi:hypothetical protein